MMQQHLALMARYNRWANDRLYATAAALPDADYRADRGAFFGSIHRTFNHILVADQLWLRRITGEGPSPPRLDTILFDDLAPLRRARQAEDERIIGLVATLDESTLARPFAYTTVGGQHFEQPLAPVLSHVFNHQTHHRGQIHALVTGLGHKAPELDLIYFTRDPAA
jgi:uncharacterized damage-inducible protein DinB